MTQEFLAKIVELKNISNWIYTNQLVNELQEFGDSNIILNDLIQKNVIHRIVEENIDICSFNTLKIKRLTKLRSFR